MLKAVNEAACAVFQDEKGCFTLSANGSCAPLCADGNDYPGALRALNDLAADIERVRYAVSIDDGEPETSVIDGYRVRKTQARIGGPGYHSLKFWMIDPGIVLTKVVVDLGRLKPSFLGPLESYFKR